MQCLGHMSIKVAVHRLMQLSDRIREGLTGGTWGHGWGRRGRGTYADMGLDDIEEAAAPDFLTSVPGPGGGAGYSALPAGGSGNGDGHGRGYVS